MAANSDAIQALQNLEAAVQGEIVQLTALAAGKPISNQWKNNIQSWPLIKTGTYRRSIHEQVFSTETTSTQAVVMVGTDIKDPPYPLYLEHGTSKMAPKPVGRMAFDEKQGEAQHEAGAVLWRLVQERMR